MTAADVLQDTFDRFDAVIGQALHRAGQGVDPHLERQLDSLACRLAALLNESAATLVHEAIELAKRVMDAADPHAPRMMLQLSRDSLAREMRRQTPRGRVRNAA